MKELEKLHYASLYRRLFAFTVDCVVISWTSVACIFALIFPVSVGIFLLGLVLANILGLEEVSLDLVVFVWRCFRELLSQLWVWALMVVYTIYNIIAELTGDTVGKNLVGIKTISVSDIKTSKNHKVLRGILKSIIVLYPVNLIMMLITQRKQSIHDKVCSTVVIRVQG